jgi:hypothetical protein
MMPDVCFSYFAMGPHPHRLPALAHGSGRLFSNFYLLSEGSEMRGTLFFPFSLVP